eukprot:2241088-Amphidinium_carterae.2
MIRAIDTLHMCKYQRQRQGAKAQAMKQQCSSVVNAREASKAGNTASQRNRQSLSSIYTLKLETYRNSEVQFVRTTMQVLSGEFSTESPVAFAS